MLFFRTKYVTTATDRPRPKPIKKDVILLFLIYDTNVDIIFDISKYQGLIICTMVWAYNGPVVLSTTTSPLIAQPGVASCALTLVTNVGISAAVITA